MKNHASFRKTVDYHGAVLGLNVALHLSLNDPEMLLADVIAEKKYVDETLRRIYLPSES